MDQFMVHELPAFLFF